MPGLGGPPACHMTLQSNTVSNASHQATNHLRCIDNAVPPNTTHAIHQQGTPTSSGQITHRLHRIARALACNISSAAGFNIRLCQTVKSCSRWGCVQGELCSDINVLPDNMCCLATDLLPMMLGPTHAELTETINHTGSIHAVTRPKEGLKTPEFWRQMMHMCIESTVKESSRQQTWLTWLSWGHLARRAHDGWSLHLGPGKHHAWGRTPHPSRWASQTLHRKRCLYDATATHQSRQVSI